MYISPDKFVLEKGISDDFRKLERFHYRMDSPGVIFRVFRLRWDGKAKFDGPAGVIVYTMPALSVNIRSRVFADVLEGLGQAERLDFLNTNFRTISRVIVDPRVRGIGLAVKMVRESIERINTKVIESMAVMGRVNKFFEKAGMNPVCPPGDERVTQMREAFSMVGLEYEDLVDAEKVRKRIEKLEPNEKRFIDKQTGEFIKAYGKRRDMPKGNRRMRYVISKLSARPIYYYKIKN